MLASIVSTLASVVQTAGSSLEEEVKLREAILRWAAAYMRFLAQVPRFGTLLLFMSSAEKERARELGARLNANGMEIDGWAPVYVKGQ